MRVNKPALTIKSYKGEYPVTFTELFEGVSQTPSSGKNHYIVDKNVARLYEAQLREVLNSEECVLVEANENNKSYDKVGDVISELLAHKIKRNDTVVAIGGGIIQDITAFICSVLFRGLKWKFYPTTLLAQADSCVGSKSSINFKDYKNQIGTFTPPSQIAISTEVLKTLSPVDIKSGIGEIIKIHLLAGPSHWSYVEENYEKMLQDYSVLEHAIERSLNLKKPYVEKDEFDENIRLVLNYGHSFGHALESATNFEIPHGIAVSMGMDMANFYSHKKGFIDASTFQRLHALNYKNYKEYKNVAVGLDDFLKALAKDKKNTSQNLMLILMQPGLQIERTPCLNDEFLRKTCEEFFEKIRKN
jgi:3-dehydroquinate synthase